MKQKQFLFWITYFSYGKVTKDWLVLNCTDDIATTDDADKYLQDNMSALMNEHDWVIVNNYCVTKIGYNLLTPSQAKAIRAEKKVLKEQQAKQKVFNEILEEGKFSSDNFWKNTFQDMDFTQNPELDVKIKQVVENKKILFLEGDNVLTNSVGNFYQWFLHNNIEALTLFNVREIPKELVLSKIIEFDVIVFESQFVYEESNKLIDFVKSLPQHKTIIQCIVREPRWFYLPDDAQQHDIFIMDSFQENSKDWEFKQLRLDKAYWEE